MRGDNIKQTSTAYILDTQGQLLYKVVASTWAKLIIAGFAVLLLINVVLATMIFVQNKEIQELKQEVEVISETNVNTN